MENDVVLIETVGVGQLLLMLHIRDRGPRGAGATRRCEPPLLRTMSAREEGIPDLPDACFAHRIHLESSGPLGAADRLAATPARGNPTEEEGTRAGGQEGAVRVSHGDPLC